MFSSAPVLHYLAVDSTPKTGLIVGIWQPLESTGSHLTVEQFKCKICTDFRSSLQPRKNEWISMLIWRISLEYSRQGWWITKMIWKLCGGLILFHSQSSYSDVSYWNYYPVIQIYKPCRRSYMHVALHYQIVSYLLLVQNEGLQIKTRKAIRLKAI